MTIEQIIFTIEETIRACNDCDSYEEGYQDALFWVSDLLDKIEPSWHPYPAEKPPKDGELYWVTLDYDDGPRIATDDLFLNGKFVNYSEYAIVAWAEYNRPKPYVKEDET